MFINIKFNVNAIIAVKQETAKCKKKSMIGQDIDVKYFINVVIFHGFLLFAQGNPKGF